MKIHLCSNSMSNFSAILMSPWRNWLARSAVNRKVGGSNPLWVEFFAQILIIKSFALITTFAKRWQKITLFCSILHIFKVVVYFQGNSLLLITFFPSFSFHSRDQFDVQILCDGISSCNFETQNSKKWLYQSFIALENTIFLVIVS